MFYFHFLVQVTLYDEAAAYLCAGAPISNCYQYQCMGALTKIAKNSVVKLRLILLNESTYEQLPFA